jgi:hypothetical protein
MSRPCYGGKVIELRRGFSGWPDAHNFARNCGRVKKTAAKWSGEFRGGRSSFHGVAEFMPGAYSANPADGKAQRKLAAALQWKTRNEVFGAQYSPQ